MIHNYVAEPGQYPTTLKTQGYTDQAAYNNRFKKSAKERAEIFAGKLSYEKQLKKEHGADWKKALRQMSKASKPFDKSIVSGTKVLAQWN